MRFNKALFFLLFLAACGGREESKNGAKEYADIRGYFEKEAARLQKQNLTIEKTVSQNNDFEKKQLLIADWKTELELFTESDINKPAWRNSYRVVKKGAVTEYLSDDDKLKTRKISLTTSPGGAFKQIHILNKTSNILYSSTEELMYIPDSIYSIKKQQEVFILGKNSYSILGEI